MPQVDTERELKRLAREMGDAGYCNYAACREYLQQAYELGRPGPKRLTSSRENTMSSEESRSWRTEMLGDDAADTEAERTRIIDSTQQEIGEAIGQLDFAKIPKLLGNLYDAGRKENHAIKGNTPASAPETEVGTEAERKAFEQVYGPKPSIERRREAWEFMLEGWLARSRRP